MRFARLQSRTIVRLQRRSAACALLALTLAAFALEASPATANVGEELILRCTHGKSLSGYSQADYRKALEELSATAEEYSPCAAQIRAAQLAAAAGGNSGGPGGSAPAAAPVPTSPAQQRAISHAQSAPPTAVKLGSGGVVSPGVVHVDVASALSSLPSPVLALLALLLVGLLTIAAGALRKRVGGRAD
jgi:hypothetical protein